MNVEIRVRAVRKTQWKKNPVSGHEWPEYGPATGWEVVGPLGVVSTHKTPEKAEKAEAEAKAWRDYYQKYPIS